MNIADVEIHRRTAFCIAQVTFSAGVTKKIVDEQCTKHYIKRLGDKVVWEHFCPIITKARKFTSDTFKATFDGWEKKLREAHLKEEALLKTAARGERRAQVAKRRFEELSDMDLDEEEQHGR